MQPTNLKMMTKATAKKRGAQGRKIRPNTSVVRIVAINKVYGKLCRESLKRVRSPDRKRLSLLAFDRWQDVDLEPVQAPEVETVFVSPLRDIPERVPPGAQAGSSGRHLLFAESLPVEAIASRLVGLGVKNAQRLHIAREDTSAAISGLLFRVFSGAIENDGPQRIADAWIEGDRLVLLAPSFQRLAIPLAKLEKFVGKNNDKIGCFEIDEDGSFLFWPHADVHLGWEQLLMLVDPTKALRAKQKTHAFNQRYGAAIRRFREENELRQADIKGLAERHLRRVEKGELMASKKTLELLAAAHHLDVNEYMNEIARRL